jgi:hypothetical protein
MKNKWGIVVGQPTFMFDGPAEQLRSVGAWVQLNEAPLLFNTRREAREEAKLQQKFMPMWNYHARKFG